jgi:mannose-1-phosphate guanylyltransferase
LPPGNVIVQPCNRGTATGVLLTLLCILERDPLARIVFLPADHHVRDECGPADSVRDATSALASNPEALVYKSVMPETAARSSPRGRTTRSTVRSPW